MGKKTLCSGKKDTLFHQSTLYHTVIRPKAPSRKKTLLHQLMKSLRWEKRHSVVGKKTLYSISQHCTTQWSDQKLLVGKNPSIPPVNEKFVVGKKPSIPPVNEKFVVGKKRLYSTSQHCRASWSDQKLVVGEKTLCSTSWSKAGSGEKKQPLFHQSTQYHSGKI